MQSTYIIVTEYNWFAVCCTLYTLSKCQSLGKNFLEIRSPDHEVIQQ